MMSSCKKSYKVSLHAKILYLKKNPHQSGFRSDVAATLNKIHREIFIIIFNIHIGET